MIILVLKVSQESELVIFNVVKEVCCESRHVMSLYFFSVVI